MRERSGLDPFALAARLRDAPLEPTLRRLAKLFHERARAAGEPEPFALRSGYDRARERFFSHRRRLEAQLALSDDVIAQLLPPAPAPSSPPTEEDRMLAALRAIQEFVLRHPVAARAAYAALVAEGRAFAETEAGRALHDSLQRSQLLQRARLLWEMASLHALSEETPDLLPSAYLDGLFLAAATRDPDELLDRLFGAGGRPRDGAV